MQIVPFGTVKQLQIYGTYKFVGQTTELGKPLPHVSSRLSIIIVLIHNQTIVNVQDGAAVTGLVVAAVSLVAVNTTGNAIYDPIGSIIVGNLLGMVCGIYKVLFIANEGVLDEV